MSTREDARERPLDPPMLPHETRKDSVEGQILKEHLAGKKLPGTDDGEIDESAEHAPPTDRSGTRRVNPDEPPV